MVTSMEVLHSSNQCVIGSVQKLGSAITSMNDKGDISACDFKSKPFYSSLNGHDFYVDFLKCRATSEIRAKNLHRIFKGRRRTAKCLTAPRIYSLSLSLISLKSLEQSLPTRQSNTPKLSLDPVKLLPLEIIDQIWIYLPFLTLVRCRAVSKVWKQYVDNIPALWRQHLDFSTANSPLESRTLEEYVGLCRPNDLGNESIKILTLTNSTKGNGTIECILNNHFLFETLTLKNESVSVAEFITCHCPPEITLNSSMLFPRLRKLSISTVLTPVYIAAVLNRIPSLKELEYALIVEGGNIIGSDIPDCKKPSDLEEILRIEEDSYFGLEKLKLTTDDKSREGKEFLSTVIPIIERCSKLKSLSLQLGRNGHVRSAATNISAEHAGVSHRLAQLLEVHLSQLESIHFRGPLLSDEDYYCVKSRNLRNVTIEDLGFGNVIEPGTRLIDSLQVQHLSLPGFTSDPLSRPVKLNDILDATNLEALDMDRSRTSELSSKSGFISLMGGDLPHLNRLGLRSCYHVTDSTIQGIIETCINLKELDIGGTKVSDRGVITAVNSGITKLFVSNLNLSQSTIEWAGQRAELIASGVPSA